MIGFYDHIKDRIQGKASKGQKRDKRWRKVRETHLTKEPKCAICGGVKELTVHHKIPFHVAPDLELEPSNLVTLCEAKKYGINCHLLVGHLGNYSRMNTQVEIDVMIWNKKLSCE